MKFLPSFLSVMIAAQFVSASPVFAQTECIENAEGSRFCGKDAEAEKERIRTALVMRQGGRSGTSSAAAPARPGSAYNNFSRRAFVRGGTAFSGGGSEFADNFSIAGGAGFNLGNRSLSVETEILALRDTETVSDPFLGPLTVKALALAGLVSLRYDLPTSLGVNPFASVGVGPGYVRATLDTGAGKTTFDDFTFAYSGRAGIAVDFSDRFGIEAAYRYLDTTQSGFAAQHLVELGLNLGF